MIDVVSIKFKNRGKSYFFSPNGLTIHTGDRVIVETSKGLEIADCSRGNHPVMDTAVVQPLRPVVRVATKDDLRVAQINVQREKEAFEICQKKIQEHGLDMKLVDVECNFEGTKTMFFFTSDGRVDFRELVKELAGIFRNRIELRQIGVRDEAKMIGGIGICGRPYCCSQFLDEFQPVSTKMAKIQSLSLNPTKISGSCGRLMCCLRYEQEAYEDLIKKVPKQGSFVETKDGFGTAVQVNLLRQTVKVKLDSDSDDSLRSYKPNELCAVPGGRPKDGEEPVSTFTYVPEPAEEAEPDPAETPEEAVSEPAVRVEAEYREKPQRHRNKQKKPVAKPEEPAAEAKPEVSEEKSRRRHRGKNRQKPVRVEAKAAHHQENAPESKPADRRETAQEAKPAQRRENAPEAKQPHHEKVKPHRETPKAESSEAPAAKEGAAAHKNNRRRYYRGKSKNKGGYTNQ